MFKLSEALPEDGYITLDAFCKDPQYKKGTVILFDNDKDFIAFCVAPVAVVDTDKEGNPCAYHGQYTEMYRKCLKAGIKFGIREEDSFINKNKVASTRVLFPKGFDRLRKDALVFLPVRNLEELCDWYYLCDGMVYTRRSIMAMLVSNLACDQGKTEEEILTILRSCCRAVLSDKQFGELDQEGKDQYKSLSIGHVRYHYSKMSERDLLTVAARHGVMIEPLVIKEQ